MPASSVALTPAQDATLTECDRRAAKAQSILDAALEAPNAESLAEDSVERRIAMDARQSVSKAPVYLAMARSLVELKMKLDAGLAGDSAPKLVHHVVHLVKPREYERVELGPVIEAEAVDVDTKKKGRTSG